MTDLPPSYPGQKKLGLVIDHDDVTDPRRPTGCTVVLVGDGAACGVDVRGGAPGTRETDLLSPLNLVDRVHAVYAMRCPLYRTLHTAIALSSSVELISATDPPG